MKKTKNDVSSLAPFNKRRRCMDSTLDEDKTITIDDLVKLGKWASEHIIPMQEYCLVASRVKWVQAIAAGWTDMTLVDLAKAEGHYIGAFIVNGVKYNCWIDARASVIDPIEWKRKDLVYEKTKEQ